MARPRIGAGLRAAPKGYEQVPPVAFGKACTSVRHLEHNFATLDTDGYIDRSVTDSMADRIADEVERHLTEAYRIRKHRRRFQRAMDGQACRLRLGTQVAYHRGDDPGDVDGAPIQIKHIRMGQRAKILDDAGQLLDLAEQPVRLRHATPSLVRSIVPLTAILWMIGAT